MSQQVSKTSQLHRDCKKHFLPGLLGDLNKKSGVTAKWPPEDSDNSFINNFFLSFSYAINQAENCPNVCGGEGYRIYNVATASGHLHGALFPDRKKPASGSPVPEGQHRQAILVRWELLCRQLFPLVQDTGAEGKGIVWPVSSEGRCKAALLFYPLRAEKSPRDLCPPPKSIYNNPLKRRTF